ncbi:MAG: hemin uptake protein HemP [Thermomonas sp.]|uniref:hemin uptake protein HemP n=1 Tax=Thermomonas sp. TaxID=1971895 RepID=UPI00263702AA|nr:hemin uptake protein HemP [Thermomonas sp.]MCC7096162.1 hemin uptake protein HemP [Thermomonas sp.]
MSVAPTFEQPAAPQPRPAPTPSAQMAALDSTQLLRGQCEVLIQHGNEVYRLRHTRNGKLILTK